MGNFHEEYSQYYDLLYRDKNYEAESRYVLNTLKNWKTEIKDVLELGCGSGNHAQYLVKNALNVWGIEQSKMMVSEARGKKIANFYPQIGNITSFQLDKKFDAVISLFHVISYLTENKDLLNCFQLVNQHLKLEGIFLFDVWYSPAVYTLKPETKIKRIEDGEIEIIRIAESEMRHNYNVVDVQFEVVVKNKPTNQTKTIIEKHSMRHFSIPEINLLAQMSNFQVVLVEEFLTQNPVSQTSWGVTFVLKKIL